MDKPSYGIHIASYAVGYCMGCEKWKCDSKLTVRWGCLALVFSLIRLLLDTTVMAADYTIYYYYDATFQPIARFTLAMWIFCVSINHTEQIEDWALKHKKIDQAIQIFSAASFEVYLTHQFMQLSVWEFFPHNGLSGMTVWLILSIVLTAINTVVLKLICLGIEKKIVIPLTKRNRKGD